MTSYFSRLLSQSGLPAALERPASAGSLQKPVTELQGIEQGNTAPPANPISATDSLAERAAQPAPPGPRAVRTGDKTGPEPSSHPKEQHELRGGEPVAMPQEVVRPARPDQPDPTLAKQTPQPPADWLGALKLAREWVSAGSAPPGEAAQLPEAAPRIQNSALEASATERQAAEFVHTVSRPVDFNPWPAAGYGDQDLFEAEQHQELNLTIGSIVVTVEGPHTPAAVPAARPREGGALNRRGADPSRRLSRHYLRLS